MDWFIYIVGSVETKLVTNIQLYTCYVKQISKILVMRMAAVGRMIDLIFRVIE